MKLNDWYTSNLDDTQRQIVMIDFNNSFIVQGSAGSGKTILALQRAAQANVSGTFALIVYTKALKTMIEFGLKVLKLPPERAVYEWSWFNRGIDVKGDVYYENNPANIPWEINPKVLFLKKLDERVEKYEQCNAERYNYFETIHSKLLDKTIQLSTTERKSLENEINKIVTIDFGDFVPDKIYYTFKRREKWFELVNNNSGIQLDNNPKYSLITAGGLFSKKMFVDFMIVDEVQDFSINEILNFKTDTIKSMLLLGDTLQQVYSNRGTSMDNIASSLKLQRYFLTFNYRLPKTVAKVAELVSVKRQNLVETSRRNNGKTDFPDFPKPVIKKCESREDQLDFIVQQIQKENLDDVGILVPNNDDVKEVFEYLNKKNFDVQVKIIAAIAGDPFGRFRQIDTLDFTNPTNPSILTYHSSKGTQFENIFLPFAENGVERSPFYVGMTRTSRRLFITYQNRLTSLLDEIPKEYFDIK
jgi:hypothetical protein